MKRLRERTTGETRSFSPRDDLLAGLWLFYRKVGKHMHVIGWQDRGDGTADEVYDEIYKEEEH